MADTRAMAGPSVAIIGGGAVGLSTAWHLVQNGLTEITVLEVVQALDGKVGEEGKEAGGIWAEGVEALRGVFRSTTIADIARREADEAGSQMYYI